MNKKKLIEKLKYIPMPVLCHVDDRLYIAELISQVNEMYRQEISWLYSYNFFIYFYKTENIAKLQRIGFARRKTNTWLRDIIIGMKNNY
ncbi:hypothetical protein [Pectobacterium versatile]|uniref:hypothetical protein n=1 Tax=Pectobacterium versatile TaxID=2488639 RepID=UPI001F23924A|nr:hypothetical protein [Pectobacterium versatile]